MVIQLYSQVQHSKLLSTSDKAINSKEGLNSVSNQEKKWPTEPVKCYKTQIPMTSWKLTLKWLNATHSTLEAHSQQVMQATNQVLLQPIVISLKYLSVAKEVMPCNHKILSMPSKLECKSVIQSTKSEEEMSIKLVPQLSVQEHSNLVMDLA